MKVCRVTLRYEITDAQLIMKTRPAEVKVETQKNGLQIENKPIQLKIDNTDFFNSIGIKSMDKLLSDAAENGKRAIAESMQRYADEKNAMLGPDALTIAQISSQRSIKTITSALAFIPDTKPEIKWEGGHLNISYIKDERNVELTPSEIEYEYIPYSVKIFAERTLEDLESPLSDN